MAGDAKKGRRKEHTLLEPTERARLKEWGGTGWMSSPRRISARRRATHTIDRLVEAQRSANAPWPEDPRVLAGLLAVSLRADGSVVEHFNSRGASDLRTDEQWDEFFKLFAQAHVEHWLEQRNKKGEQPTEAAGLVVEDDYLDSLNDLLALAQQEGKQNQEQARKEEHAKTFNMAKVSDLTNETRERLQIYLEKSDLFAHEVEGDDIPLDEQEREIETAALSRLKLKDLKELAAEKGIPLVASKEGLATLIVRRSDITREQIAVLALRDTEVSIDTGLVTRLFPLGEQPNIAAAAARLARVQGRYMKLRLARWFVYDRTTQTSSTVILHGRIRSYRIKPVLEVEGHRLNADPHSAEMVVRLRTGRYWVEVDGRQLTDARDIEPVMARGAGMRFNSTMALPLPALSGLLGTWSRQTVWMLAFLQLHLEGDGIAIHNYSMAHFEAAKAGIPVRPDEPRIAEVQLRGQHVGSSRDACQRIVDGGGLLAVEVMLSFAPDQNNNYLIPVRIEVDDTCATVRTGAGRTIPPAASSRLHGILVDRVRRALESELNPNALNGLMDKIVDRARAREPAEHADMFAPTLNISSSQQ